MTDTQALIARLEAATGPDRELDARIWCHLNGKKYIGHGTPYGERDGLFVQVEYTTPPKRTRQVTNNPHTPHARCYTASIDAALTLAEDKQAVLREAIRWLGDRFRLHVNFWPADQNYAQWLALAIVIAALRAIEARQQ